MKDIFNILTDDEAELKILRVKSKLMRGIVAKIRSDGMTQIEAAKKVGTNQARISRITRGQASLLTIDFLIKCAVRLNVDTDGVISV